MLRLRDCEERREAGPKARRLGRALALGLPVLDGIVVLPDEPVDAAALSAALAGLVPAGSRSAPPRGLLPDAGLRIGPGLGGMGAAPLAEAEPERFVVRSSAAVEDLPERSAAGLFLSQSDVPAAEVPAAIAAVRASGKTAAVRAYCGGEVGVAVLIQPKVQAERLGVLFFPGSEADGDARCEERPLGTPEWGDITPRIPDERDPSDRLLLDGSRQLARLLGEELGAVGAVFVEYARADTGAVTFLQVRPAPRSPASERAHAAWPVPPDAGTLTYRLDHGHNPDPLSAAQAGLVGGVADLVPALRQCVVGGYLYYADAGQPDPATLIPPAELLTRFTGEIAPACEALLRPLEAQLLAEDGALAPQLVADPAAFAVPLARAWAAYRGVYRRYMAELGPSLRRARGHLDQLLRTNLGEPLSQHGALLGGIARAQTERLYALRELGRALPQGAAVVEPALRRYLAHYGAYAPCWDVAVPCDDEAPSRVCAAAARLVAEADIDPGAQHEAAQAAYHRAVQALLDRLPRMARGALKAMLPSVQAALSIGEDDDALFFRAQRLVRWALLSRGARLVQAGRLPSIGAVFDLPWALHQPELARPLEESEEKEKDAPGWAEQFAVGVDLASLARAGSAARTAARSLAPPTRFSESRAYWALPAGTVLFGYGVSVEPRGAAGEGAADGEAALVRGVARVIGSLDEAAEVALAGLSRDSVLVLPAILPSWAQHLCGARALVTDSGGAFSHGAILARERGLPAVLGARGATRAIRDGQTVWVDAARGRVYLEPRPGS